MLAVAGLAMLLMSAPMQAQDGGEREVAACAEWIRSNEKAERNTARTHVVSPRTLCFDGELFAWTTEQMRAWIDAAAEGDAPVQLVVRSVGGDAAVTISLAETLQRLGARTIIVDYCMSSCANYLFAAMPGRSVEGRAVVLYHGGYSPGQRRSFIQSVARATANPETQKHIADPQAWAAQQLATYDAMSLRQTALFARAGVNLAIVTGMSDIDTAALAAEECGSRRGERAMLFLRQDDHAVLGMPLAAGVVEDDPTAVDLMLERFGFPFTACRIGEAFPP